MADHEHDNLIERIHASGKQLMLSITGGGSRAIASLLEVPGASASVVGAVVPYAATALEHFLGGPVDQHCSERTARAMAMRALQLARSFSSAELGVLVGVGATASLATTRPKRGPHRIYVAWQSAERTVSFSSELAKGERTRREEETLACSLILTAVADACGLAGDSLLEPKVAAAVQRRDQMAPKPWSELLLGKRACVSISDELASLDHRTKSHGDSEPPAILFPGAFNPLHEGHREMAALASQQLGTPTTFELSIANVDKPTLDFIEMADRLEGLSGCRVLLTRAPTFAEKATLAPGTTFVVGVDTLRRIADLRYYHEDAAYRDAAIDTIRNAGCRFLVFGRLVDDRYLSLRDLELPVALRELCDEVPEATFRRDISSSELRTE